MLGCEQCGSEDIKASFEQVRSRGLTLVLTCQRCGLMWRNLSTREISEGYRPAGADRRNS